MGVPEQFIDPSSYADNLRPPAPSPGVDGPILKWIRQRIADGQQFNVSQPGYASTKSARRILRNEFNGRLENQIDPRLSDVSFNRQKRQFKDVVFTLSNAEPEMGFDMPPDDPDRPTTTDQERHFTDQLNSRLQEYLIRPESRSRIRDWLYLSGLGIAYISPIMGDPLSPDVRDDDVKWVVYDGDDILFSGMGRDRDPQSAETAILCNRIPLQRMRDKYPQFKFQPDFRDAWYLRGFVGKILNAISPSIWDIDKRKAQEPSVLLYHCYINDRSINRSGQTIKMGYTSSGKETAWSYDVPSYGAMVVPTGIYEVNPDGSRGPQKLRPATEEEARIYPNRRLIICTDQFVLYDGPSYWAHGLVPAVPYRMEDCPTEFNSGSFFLDSESMQRALDRVMRGLDDTNARNQKIPIFYDSQQLSPQDAAELGKFLPGSVTPFDTMENGRPPIIPTLPPEYTHIDERTFEYIKFLMECMDYALGTNDLKAIQDKGQIPQSDTVEQIYQMAGVLTTDRGRRMELAMRDLGYMTGMLFSQFDSLKRRLRLNGPNGINPADFDYDPSNMIPSHLPGEDQSQPSFASRMQRTKFYMGLRKFFIVANSAYGLLNTSEALKLELLRERGFPISDKTVAKVNKIKDYANEVKEWAQEQEMKAKVQGGAAAVSQAQIAIGQVLTQAGLSALMGQLAQGAGGGGGVNPPSNPVGRPQTYAESPRIETKDQGQRQTISTADVS